MKAFFFGCLLIFLDFHLELNSVRIGLLPNFLGYYLLLRGMRELKEYSPHFSAPRGVVAALMVYSAILWGLDLLGLGEEYLPVELQVLLLVLGLLATLGLLYSFYQIVSGILEMETAFLADLRGKTLRHLWMAMAALDLSVSVCWLLALSMNAATNIELFGGFIGILAVISVIMKLVFTYYIYRSGQAYEAALQGKKSGSSQKSQG